MNFSSQRLEASDFHAEIIFEEGSYSPEKIASVLRARGVVLLRGICKRETALYAGRAVHENAQALRRLLDREVNDMPLCFADLYQTEFSQLPPSYKGGSTLAEFGDPLGFSSMDRSWYYEGERNFKRWFWEMGARFPNVVLKMVLESMVPAIARAYFSDSVISPYQHDTVRYQRADIANLSYSFHQDGSYHSREKRERHSLTVWAPLADCGEDAPALELYPYRLDEILPLAPGVSMPNLFCDEALVMERYGDRLWAPKLRAGDVLMFDGFTVHRSYILPGMTKERQSADIRFYPVSDLPAFVEQAVGWKVIV